MNEYRVSGTVEDAAGNPISNAPVAVFDRATMSKIGTTLSGETGGSFQFQILSETQPPPVVVVALNCPVTWDAVEMKWIYGAPTSQASVVDYITPVLIGPYDPNPPA